MYKVILCGAMDRREKSKIRADDPVFSPKIRADDPVSGLTPKDTCRWSRYWSLKDTSTTTQIVVVVLLLKVASRKFP